MEKFTIKLRVLFLVFVFGIGSLYAQKIDDHDHHKHSHGENNKHSHKHKCGTELYYEYKVAADPHYWDKVRADGERYQREHPELFGPNAKNVQREAIIIVPVVFHIVGTATLQSQVTDADVRRLVDILNRDYAGINADSTKIPAAFKPLFGKSEIRFVLAKRTPGANPVCTNGIERRVNNIPTITPSNDNIVKTTANGGLDAWDVTRYFNLWVCAIDPNLLGWATFPSATLGPEQGVVMGYQYFDSPCIPVGSASVYQYGRTITHEVGHYFYLYHIWGDDGNACTGSDFREISGLPITNQCTDDTPNQAGATFGCYTPGQVLTDACSPTAPGKNWQNYMDYTDDQCMYMFTKSQVCRMTKCIELYRTALLTTQGHIPPPGCGTANDGRISEIISPMNSRGYSCNQAQLYTACVSTVSPNLLLANDGNANLTSAQIQLWVGTTLLTTFNWTGNIIPGDVASVTIPNVTLPAVTNGVFEARITQVNGVADVTNVPGNSAFARISSAAPAQNVPLAPESFEGSTFPPAGWQVVNGNPGSITWDAFAVGNPGSRSAYMDHWDYSTQNHVDYLITPKVITNNLGGVTLNFNYAYGPFSITPGSIYMDTLEIMYTTDCGATYLPTGWKKWGAALSTTGTTVFSSSQFVPTATQWKTESVQLDFCNGAPAELSFAFKATNRYGNNLYIDNVGITGGAIPNLDVAMTSVVQPSGPQCVDSLRPRVVLTNLGATNVTSATITYSYSGGPVNTFNWTGALNRCQTATVDLPPIPFIATVNPTVFTATVSAPNGQVDANPNNNTATGSFPAFPFVSALPYNVNFTTGSFTNWGAIQVNALNAITWEVANVGNFAPSARYRFFDNTTKGDIDIIRTPNINIAALDTIKLSFDWAYAKYSNTDVDTVQLVASYDCGQTWVPFGDYRRFGDNMVTNSTATPPAATTTAFTPSNANQWRNYSVSVPACSIPSRRMMIGWRAVNGYGNNYYLDNVRITGVTALNTDADIKLLSPNNSTLYCNAADATPRIRLTNNGQNTLTSLTLSYRYDNNAVVTQNWTGNLQKCQFVDITLPTLVANTVQGGGLLTIYSSNPNGVADQRLSNDTVRTIININADVPGADKGNVRQNFEEAGASISSGLWARLNQDNLQTWEMVNAPLATTAVSGQRSALINNWDYNANGTFDIYASPRVTPTTGADSVTLSFDYSYKPGYTYPGSTTQPLDTLEIIVTKDCGVTGNSVWKKWGLDLHTETGNSVYNNTYIVKHVPSQNNMWKNVKINLTPVVGTDKFNVFFRNRGNNGNQLWLDNININSIILPAKLKSQGYLIYPSPFQNSFRIHHVVNPVDLRGVQVFNSVGQLIWESKYNGNAPALTNIDVSKYPAGLYVVKLNYTNKSISERIIKQ